jgi:hypothetical protein
MWVYLNWALALKALGCRVIWLEGIDPATCPDILNGCLTEFRRLMEPYGLADRLALYSQTEAGLPAGFGAAGIDLEAAAEADLLLNLRYDTCPEVVDRFRRSALIDIDPGLLQVWMSVGQLPVARHDCYFSIGETVGRPEAKFPDGGRRWHYTPPCVALDSWPVRAARAEAPFTTVSQWYTKEWMQEGAELYNSDKRSGFLPFLDLPQHTSQPLELALCLGEDEDEERAALLRKGWRVRDAGTVAATPWDYQRYIQESRGEFSCAKPAYRRRATAWISDRTLCYLGSGKPAVVEHTGASRFLPDAAGLFRFRDLDEAVRFLDHAAGDYQHQCQLARALAEEYFDARKVASKVLERALA